MLGEKESKLNIQENTYVTNDQFTKTHSKRMQDKQRTKHKLEG